MAKLLFDDGTKVEISKETAENLRKELSKPKEREIEVGDCFVLSKSDLFCVVIDTDTGGNRYPYRLLWSDGAESNWCEDSIYRGLIFHYNIFRDLAAIQEDGADFEINCVRARTHKAREDMLVIASQDFSLPKAKDFVLKLRQLIATMERKLCSKP